VIGEATRTDHSSPKGEDRDFQENTTITSAVLKLFKGLVGAGFKSTTFDQSLPGRAVWSRT